MKEIINFLTWLNKNDDVKNIIKRKESIHKESKSIDAKTFENFVKKEIIPVAKANGFNFEAQDYLGFLKENKSKILSDEDLEYVSGGKKLFIPAILMSMINVAQFGTHTTTYAVPPKPFEILNSQKSIEENLVTAKNDLKELKIKYPRNSREICDVISFVEKSQQNVNECIQKIKLVIEGKSILDYASRYGGKTINNAKDAERKLDIYNSYLYEYRDLIDDESEINKLTEEIKQIENLKEEVREILYVLPRDLENQFQDLQDKINDSSFSDPSLNISETYNTRKLDSIKKELLKEFNNIDPSLKWKLIIDGQYHWCDNSKIFDNAYDNKGNRVAGCDAEEGYRDAMLSALDYTFSEECMNKKFDANLYLKIHQKACSNVTKTFFEGSPVSTEFREAEYGAGFYLQTDSINGNFSPEGREQYENKKDSPWKSDKLFVANENGLDLAFGIFEAPRIWFGNSFGAPVPKTNDGIEKAVNLIFEEYYNKLEELSRKGYVEGSLISKDSSLDDKKLEIIIRICQNLDLLHAWTDGNIRTITFLVMQRMLIENGLTPVIFNDPNYIDFRSVEEIMGTLKAGQETYRQIVKESETLNKGN